MQSHTIKVTGVSDGLLKLLDDKIVRQHASCRSEYIRELIRRDVVPVDQKLRSFRELLAPIHADSSKLDITEEELEVQIEQARNERFAGLNSR